MSCVSRTGEPLTLSPSPAPLTTFCQSPPATAVSPSCSTRWVTQTAVGSEPETHSVPPGVHQIRRPSPETESNATAGNMTKRRRPNPPEHACEDVYAWILGAWLKNKFISPDRVREELMMFELNMLGQNPRETGFTGADFIDARQDVTDAADPGSASAGVQSPGLIGVRSADDMQGTMEAVRHGQPTRPFPSFEQPLTTPEPLPSIEGGPISDQTVVVVADAGVDTTEFPFPSPSPVQVKREPWDDGFTVPSPPRAGDRLGEFLVVEDGDRMVIALDDGDTFASGDESDDVMENSDFQKKPKSIPSDWVRGLNEMDPTLEKTLLGQKETRRPQEDEDEEEEAIFLKDDAYGVGATDDSALSTSETLRKKLFWPYPAKTDFQAHGRIEGCSIRAFGVARPMGRSL